MSAAGESEWRAKKVVSCAGRSRLLWKICHDVAVEIVDRLAVFEPDSFVFFGLRLFDVEFFFDLEHHVEGVG